MRPWGQPVAGQGGRLGMWHRLAPEVRTIVGQAEDMAKQAGNQPSSVHFLLALFVTPSAAGDTLAEAGIDEQQVLRTFKSLPGRDESPSVMASVREQARQLVESSQADEIDSTILLASLLRVRHSHASRVLRRAGVNLPALRAQIIGQLTLGVDRASSSRLRAIQMEERVRSSGVISRPVFDPADGDDFAPPPRRTPRERPADNGLTDPLLSRLAGTGRRPAGGKLHTAMGPISTPENRSSPPKVAAPPAADRQDPGPERPAVQGPAATATPAAAAQPSGGDGNAALFFLDPERFPVVCELGRDLTRAGLAGEVTTLIGREDLVDSVIDVLLMRQTNNPCLVGEAGVGKTAIAEGLAAKIAGRTDLYGRLGEAVVVEIQVASLLAGTSMRGSFSERMTALRDEVAAADGRIIIFIDEVHTLMGAGAGDGPLDAANDLKTALARGRFPLICATTRDEYRRHIEKDPAMERRLQLVEVPEPGAEEAIAILSGVAATYAAHHGLPYSHEAIVSAVHLSKRFITDRCLPGKAIAVLDRAGAQAKRRGKKQVGSDDVAQAVHGITDVPMDRLLADERSRIRNLAADLCTRIVGQDPAMACVARRVQRNYAGFSGDRPLASFIFIGPPGTGKTAAAAALAEALFMVEDSLVRFDMTEFTEGHSAARLVGSPPGYIGHQQPGLLSDAMHKRPYRVLLFDDVDRGADEVLALIQQILESGRITDNHGRVLDMRNSIIVLTTGVGVEALLAGNTRRPIGFGAPVPSASPGVEVEAAVGEQVRSLLPGDLWGRIDEAIIFHPLDPAAGREIVRRQLQASVAALFQTRLIQIVVDESVVDLVFGTDGVDPSLGVRPLRARVERIFEGFLTEKVLDGDLRSGAHMRITVHEGELTLRPEAEARGRDSAAVV